ncbi:MAG: hypothetical protein MUD10_01740 [Candidatus Pacebacteria bacterium]|jgi:hypothetical protein|nr:hypothetical protein [Candidatus Paceibacterota bacterium]
MSKKALLVVSIVAVIAIVGIGVYLYLPKNTGQNIKPIVDEQPVQEEISSKNEESGGEEAVFDSKTENKLTDENPKVAENAADIAKTDDGNSCDSNCKKIGYQSGYCGAWILNSDNTVSECGKGEYPFFVNSHPGSILSDCIDNSLPEATKKTICCCKGEPKNAAVCPIVNRPKIPMGCVEEPGYLRDPKTGECCWYKATCYGPEGWSEFKTKSECLKAL